MEKLVGDPIYIYLADDGEVYEVEGGYIWHWDTPEEEGKEFIPEKGAEEYFVANGREDITELIKKEVN